jgi:hypothetical protein
MSWTTLLKPWRIYKEMKKVSKRLKEKNISGNYKGEGLKTGGIIIFGKDGKPRYAYPEVTGYALQVEEFLAAVQAVQNEQMSSISPEL